MLSGELLVVFSEPREMDLFAIEMVRPFVMSAMGDAPRVEGGKDEGVNEDAEDLVHPFVRRQRVVAELAPSQKVVNNLNMHNYTHLVTCIVIESSF